MTSPTVLIPEAELEFLVHEWLEKDGGAGDGRDTLGPMLEVAHDLARDAFLSHFKKGDREEPRWTGEAVHVLPEVREALRRYAELGFFSASFPETLGGAGLPFLYSAALFAEFAAANVATAAYPMLTAANARLIAKFGSPDQVAAFALPQIEGRWFGTMCLSEPGAGSSLADITTRADPVGSDALGARYRLRGDKMWISAGDHDASANIVHLVLAKEPAQGAGISLFIVPKVRPDGPRNGVRVTGLNHKLGYRGVPNCLLAFGEETDAIGWRVGESGHGLRQMFQMMNEARILVGAGAAAIAYRAYRHSLIYASERRQGRPPGARSGPPVPIARHGDVRRMLLSQKAYADGALALCLYCARLVDEEGDAASAELLGLLTPVTKTWPSEHAALAADLAIQIHGGYGYTRDFDVEQLWRDNRLNPIHEGTTGIQAIDLLGRKILRSDGAGAAELARRLLLAAEQACARPTLRPLAYQLEDAWAQLERALAALRGKAQTEALERATPFLWAFGHVVLAWIWLDQARAAADALDAGRCAQRLHEGKLMACRFYFEAELPKIAAWLAFATGDSDVLADLALSELAEFEAA